MAVLRILKQVELKFDQQRVSYEELFLPYMRGAQRVLLSEPYICKGYQVKNLLSFINLFEGFPDGVSIDLVTKEKTFGYNDFSPSEKKERLNEVVKYALGKRVSLSYKFEDNNKVRKIVTDTGWVIKSNWGLHMYRRNGACEHTEIDYMQIEQPEVEFEDLAADINSIIIDNITAGDVQSRKIRILVDNRFLFPAEIPGVRNVYSIDVLYGSERYAATYTVDGGSGRSPILKLYRELYNDVIGIKEGTRLKITKNRDDTYTIGKIK